MNLRFAICDLRFVQPLPTAHANSFQSQFANRKSPLHRPAFSFAEILFAIIILGIGFIMVAAIFPVAIEQAKTTSDEVAGSTIARQANNAILGLAANSDSAPVQTPPIISTSPLFPGTDLVASPPAQTPGPAPTPGTTNRGKVISFYDTRLIDTAPIRYRTNLWNTASGNLISANNPAYAWIGLYKRDVAYPVGAGTPKNESPLQLFIIPVQAQATPVFSTADTTLMVTAGGQTQATLLPKPVKVAVVPNATIAGGVSLLAFDLSDANTTENVLGAAENAYVIISDDHIQTPAGPAPTSDDRGYMNGRIFRLGARRADLDTDTTTALSALGSKVVYELQAGNDFTADNGPDGAQGTADDITVIGLTTASVTVSTTADAFLIGKGYVPGTTTFEGAAMPTGAFTSFIGVN